MDPDIRWLKQQTLTMNIRLDAKQLNQFDQYKQELLAWNQEINLISENSAREIVARHFLDSLTPLPFIEKSNAKLLDVGSGAGFPGLPLKIANPRLELCLLEANRKKASFLKHMVRLLELDHVLVVHDRIDNLIRTNSFAEGFDILISRAAFGLSELQRFCDFFLDSNGLLIALKGVRVEEEIQQCLASKTHRKITQFFQYDIGPDFSGKPRKIIIGKP
ncbi:MAG TPA: 16S rRNA (guanine(527)-N(7))-methyltransferase RsmG [Smithella sp.]|nr:16S rRNA (guanine(527)-N(7))-methyltransferase RsmG [Smithella sp.]